MVLQDLQIIGLSLANLTEKNMFQLMVIVSACFDFYGVPQDSAIAPHLSWIYMYLWLESA